MDLRTQLHFDADPAAVFAMLTDEDYIARKVRAANAIGHDVTVTRTGDEVTIRLLRRMPPDVPDFLRRFVGETIDLDQTDMWRAAASDGTRHGTIAIDMVGKPVTLRGTMRLERDGEATVTTVDATIKASVPLVGGKIEHALRDGLLVAARREEEVGRAWLASG
ncbi:MAG: DUF2505 domain-containing protein [Actinomycetota bacterium]